MFKRELTRKPFIMAEKIEEKLLKPVFDATNQ